MHPKKKKKKNFPGMFCKITYLLLLLTFFQVLVLIFKKLQNCIQQMYQWIDPEIYLSKFDKFLQLPTRILQLPACIHVSVVMADFGKI